MIDAVFISDLHLHPDEADISKRFNQFIAWAATNVKTVYILGDFFHVWPGDDALDAWSNAIADQLASLAAQGVNLYFMPGNRDFLLSDRFAQRSGVNQLTEPAIITLGDERILLVHGDRYCTLDKGHQWLRRITRNRLFPLLFLRLPYSFRSKLVNEVRQRSQRGRSKPAMQMDVVASSLTSHMQQSKVNVVIHGHTHKPGLTMHDVDGSPYQQYVLSDWDDNPHILCYNKARGLYFDLLKGDQDGYK